MTAKDKAKELVGKFYVNIPLRDCDNRRPHKLALIAVDEIINLLWHTHKNETEYRYWQEVKSEIEKL